MGHFIRVIESITNKVSNVLGTTGGFLVVLLMLLISYGAISRYGFGVAHGWITEVSGYSMLIIAFLGAAQVQKNRGHVSVDLFVNMLGNKSRNLLGIIVSVLCMLLSLALFGYGISDVLQNLQDNAKLVGTIEVPKYFILVFMPIGFLFLAAYFLRDISFYIDRLRGRTITGDGGER